LRPGNIAAFRVLQAAAPSVLPEAHNRTFVRRDVRNTSKESKETDMKRLLIPTILATVLATALGLFVAGPAAADPPITISDTDTFTDVDPCTGQVHEVTIAVTFVVHLHDDTTVARGIRTLTTTGGYSGEGTSSFVENGNIEVFRFTDLLTDGSGNRIRASGVFVLDLSRDTVRVDEFELTCVGS
jgi:hypothetical protein